MKKLIKWTILAAVIAGAFWSGTVIRDRAVLNHDLIRLHVVADSDEKADQDEKLAVRDAVLDYLKKNMGEIKDTESAKEFLTEKLGELTALVNRTLEKLGSAHTGCVSLKKEPFPIRHYDTFSLPAGVYESLRITIGGGQGHNWWCVVFPQLCTPKTAEGFGEAAEAGGFSRSLIDSVTEENAEIRFFFLDVLGRVENFLFRKK